MAYPKLSVFLAALCSLGIGCNSLDECPSGFIHFNNSPGCYKIIAEDLTYDEAYRRCALLNPSGRLATVETWQEQKYIQEYLRVNVELNNWWVQPCLATFWIGLERSPRTCGSQFYWKKRNRESTFLVNMDYNAFAPGQPDCCSTVEGCTTVESCAVIQGNLCYQWNDIGCDGTTCALCEAPTVCPIVPF